MKDYYSKLSSIRSRAKLVFSEPYRWIFIIFGFHNLALWYLTFSKGHWFDGLTELVLGILLPIFATSKENTGQFIYWYSLGIAFFWGGWVSVGALNGSGIDRVIGAAVLVIAVVSAVDAWKHIQVERRMTSNGQSGTVK